MIILTDLSEVLIRGMYGIEKIIDRVYGTEISTRFLERDHETKELFNDLMRGYMPEDKFWDIFLSGYKWPFGVTEVKSLASHNFSLEIPGTFDIYAGITKYPETIKERQDSKKRINGRPEFWLVSDHIAERQEELEHLHPEIFSFVSRCIWSYDEVAIKKDPGYFVRLLKKNDLDPREVLYIDDYIDNIYESSKAGIRHIWFRNSLQLKYTLLRMGFSLSKTTDDYRYQ